MRIFNAFQIVVLFVSLPFLISWLHKADFVCSSALFYTACAVYVIGFVMTVTAWAEQIGEWR